MHLTKTFWLELKGQVIIGWYQPILILLLGLNMAFIPRSEFTEPALRLPAGNPAAPLVNGLLDAVCAGTEPLDNWYNEQARNLAGGVGEALVAPANVYRDAWCPSAPPPRDLPILAPPEYPVGSGCDSSGSANGYLAVNIAGTWSIIQPLNQFWTCGENFGLPVGSPTAFVESGQKYIGIRMQRPSGEIFIFPLTPGYDPNREDLRIAVTSFVANPCPGCAVPPARPQRPIIPRPEPPGTPPPRPEFPITINLPQLPGLPDLPVPIVYIPITPTIDINAPITFAPKVDLSPEFNFAPKVELNLGGISIEGGGYPETVPDVIEIVNEGGGECPDPCEPVDYNLIRQIAIEELDAKFPPTRPFTSETQVFTARDSGSIELPEFSRWVRITIVEKPRNGREQEGNEFAPNVFYNGWYTFGAVTDQGDRKPIQYDDQSVVVPEGATQFSYTIIGLGTASITVGYWLEA